MSTASPHASKLGFPSTASLAEGSLKGRVAIISGATRGIGRECALALAREGCNIAVAGKSTESTAGLPGSIYTVAEEVMMLGAEALPIKTNVLDEHSIQNCVSKVVEKWGRVDICVNNASALWWQPIEGTPSKKYDLITQLNARGSFLLTQACLPWMRKGKWGRVLCMSPPIETSHQAYEGMCAYNISKFGMTMVAMGVAAEYGNSRSDSGAESSITGNSLWPATIIESQASINFQMGDTSLWRKASILADAVVAICCDPQKPNGKQMIDDEYLMERGLTQEDLKVYRYDPNVDPPRLLAKHSHKESQVDMTIQRGDVKQLNDDKKKDAILSKL